MGCRLLVWLQTVVLEIQENITTYYIYKYSSGMEMREGRASQDVNPTPNVTYIVFSYCYEPKLLLVSSKYANKTDIKIFFKKTRYIIIYFNDQLP